MNIVLDDVFFTAEIGSSLHEKKDFQTVRFAGH